MYPGEDSRWGGESLRGDNWECCGWRSFTNTGSCRAKQGNSMGDKDHWEHGALRLDFHFSFLDKAKSSIMTHSCDTPYNTPAHTWGSKAAEALSPLGMLAGQHIQSMGSICSPALLSAIEEHCVPSQYCQRVSTFYHWRGPKSRFLYEILPFKILAIIIIF